MLYMLDGLRFVSVYKYQLIRFVPKTNQAALAPT